MSTVINGRELADQMQAEIQKDVEKMTQQGIQPGLVVLLVGENPASQTYVKNKERAAAKIGILSKVEKLPETISEEELLAEIDKYNQDSRFHGILVQLPLPKHIDEEKILLAIDPKKDVDGFHPMNLGRLFVGKPEMIPCTPYGIMKMFEAYDIDLKDKHEDSACIIYDRKKQPHVKAGGSGPACLPLVAYTDVINKMKKGELKKVLLVATGALMSPTMNNQKLSLPSISHAVCLEVVR